MIETAPIAPGTAIMIQHCYAGSEHAKMQVLTYPDNLAYCNRHKMDYYIYHGDISDMFERGKGGWAKLIPILGALQEGYECVIYLDADTVIADPSVDLRQACPEAGGIGMML